jgi:polysaccharide biosynthesis transport protein
LAIVAGEAADILSRHGSDYPELAGRKEQQAALNARLNLETARIAASPQQEYASASDKLPVLERQLQDTKVQVAAEADAEAKIASLQRHAEVERGLFVELWKEVYALEIERRILRGNAHVVSSAHYPDERHFPRKLPLILGGLMPVTIASVIATWCWTGATKRVRTGHRVKRATSVPMLSYIPALRDAALLNCRQVMVPSALQVVRRLYANCTLIQSQNRPGWIVVSSALPREGKTFLALALAGCGKSRLREVISGANHRDTRFSCVGDPPEKGFGPRFGAAFGRWTQCGHGQGAASNSLRRRTRL